jgi:signal transduction histidine kinase
MEGVSLDEEKRTRLNDKVQSATGSLLETMEELLLWSKTQMNHFEPKIATVNVHDVIQECLKLLQLNIDAKNINIQNSVSENQTIKTDEYFLQTILRNLLQNAVKASPDSSSIQIYWKDNTILIQNEGEVFTQKDYELTLKKELDKNSLSGLGLKLAEELSGKINARISFGDNQNSEKTSTYLQL